jgi:hypothetical protein
MKINLVGVAVLSVSIIFGGIFIADKAGVWKTESSKEPIKYTAGNFEGQYNPDDIRGSYYFTDVSELFDIPLEVLVDAFELPEDADIHGFKNKDLEILYEGKLPEGSEIGNGSVKMFVALYKGLPIELEDDNYLPKRAVDILKETADLTEEQKQFINNHEVILNDISEVPDYVHSETEVSVIMGKTSFKEIMDWGVTKEQIEEVIGEEMPNELTVVRDYCIEKGLEFSTIKEKFQSILDQ